VLIAAIAVSSYTDQKKANSPKSDSSQNQPPNITVVVKQPDSPEVKEDSEEKKADREIQRKLANFTKGLVIVGVLQALVMAFTAYLIGKQREQMVAAGDQTDKILAQMKDTSERQLRAYIGVSKVHLNVTRPEMPVGMVELQNFGQTPAYKVRQWVGIAPQPHPLLAPLGKPDNVLKSVSVMPPTVKHSSIVNLKKPFPANVVPHIGTLAWTIYVHGEVVYEDAFGTERHVSYRFIYGGPEGVKHVIDGDQILGTMNPDTEGNESD
jgi:hypothetical protein